MESRSDGPYKAGRCVAKHDVINLKKLIRYHNWFISSQNFKQRTFKVPGRSNMFKLHEAGNLIIRCIGNEALGKYILDLCVDDLGLNAGYSVVGMSKKVWSSPQQRPVPIISPRLLIL